MTHVIISMSIIIGMAIVAVLGIITIPIKKKPQSKNNVIYKIAFCDENNLNTKFGEEDMKFDTYEQADFAIRMNWNKQKYQKVNDGYPIDSAWLVIEKSIDIEE